MSNNIGTQPPTLSSVMKLNIGMLSAVGFISIILLLFGEFEHKATCIFMTLFLFGAFTLVASLDSKSTSISSKNLAISQSGNVFSLCLGLVAVWGGVFGWAENAYYYNPPTFSIFFMLLMVKLGVLGTQFVAKFWDNSIFALNTAAKVATIGLAITTVMLSIPLVLNDYIDFSGNEWYWKITAAFTLLTGLAAAIMALVWAVTREKPASRVASNLGTQGYPYDAGQLMPQESPYPPAQTQPQTPVIPPMSGNYNVPTPQTTQGLLPWPLFPDGKPLPALENGQPDFSALNR